MTAAYFVAGAFLGASAAVTGAMTGHGRDLFNGGLPGQVVSIALLVGVSWVYWAGFESSARMATPGKAALRLSVCDDNGRRISLGRASARHFAKLLSAIPLMAGFALALITPNAQALHDRIAGTVVTPTR